MKKNIAVEVENTVGQGCPQDSSWNMIDTLASNQHAEVLFWKEKF
jgi:hypothetical protein